jgi:hypothetical protein
MPFLDHVAPEALPPPRLPEGTAPPPTPQAPSLAETIAAAFRQDNPLVNVYRKLREDQFPPEPGHNPLDVIRGTDYEHYHLHRFVDSRSTAETEAIAWQIRQEEEDRKTLAAAGAPGFVAQIAAGMVDPTLALPGAVLVRGARLGYSISRSALAAAASGAAQIGAQEAILQATQETRTAGESLVAVASGAILSGLIGAGAAALLTRAERQALEQSLDALRRDIDLHATGQPAAAGAAPTDVRQLELVRTPLDLGPLRKLSVTRRFMLTAPVEARRIMADLAEMPYRFSEAEQGVAVSSGPPVNRLVMMELLGTRVAIADELDRAFAEYRFGDPDILAPRLRGYVQDFFGAATDKMSYAEFKREVSRAMLNGDRHAIPQVERVAKLIRSRVFDRYGERAEAAIEGFQRLQKDDESYFPHLWNKPLIRARRPEFVNRLVEKYKADQDVERAIQQRLSWYSAQLKSWQDQISKLEARLTRAERREELTAARAEERGRDDLPRVAGFEDQEPKGRVAELQRRQAEIALDARALAESIDLMEELVKTNPQLQAPLDRALAAFERRNIRLKIEAARHQEAGSAAKRSERRLAELTEQLANVRDRKALIEDYLVFARTMHDEVRAKIEAEIASWPGTSANEAKAALKARQEYAAKTGRAPDAPRLTQADAAVDRAVKRILESDRELSIDELRARANETVDRILGSPDGRLPYDLHQGGPRIGYHEAPPVRGSLAERRLDVSNAWAAEWIEDDIEEVVATYLRTVIPDTILSERFGDAEMTTAFRQVNEAYAKLIDATKEEKDRIRLGKERDMVIADLAAVRDRIRHVYGWSPDAATQNMARVARGALAINNILSMGMATITSLADLAGVVFRYNLGTAFRDAWVPFFRGLITRNEEWKQFKAQIRAFGIGVETAINARQHALDDIVDVYRPQSRLERTLQGASDKFFIINLMAPFTDTAKTIAAHAATSEIIRASRAVAEGKATRKQIANLAEAGIDQQMAGRIWQQFTTSGAHRAGVYLPNTGDWTDRAAAEALNGAVAREVDIAVVTPGQEKLLFLSRPVGAMLGQFKSFTAAATERILVANLQRRDAAALAGVFMSLALGMLSYKINAFFGGQPTSDRPQDWIKEGISRAGLLGWLEDGNALASKATRGGVDIYRLIGADKPLSRFVSRSAADMLLGPTWGKIETIPRLTGSLAAGEWSAADTSALRRLIPLQNLFWLRGVLNKVEEAANAHFQIPEKREPAQPR